MTPRPVPAAAAASGPAPGLVVVVSISTPSDLIRAGIGAMLALHPGRVRLLDDQDPTDAPRAHLEIVDVVNRAEPRLAGDGVRPVALVRPDDAAMVRRARALGAVAHVPLDVTADLLVSTLHRVRDSGAVRSPVPPPTLLRDLLTVREHEILERICGGMTNGEIADDLFLSINSVKTHIRSTYRKIGVSRRSQAVLWGLGQDT